MEFKLVESMKAMAAARILSKAEWQTLVGYNFPPSAEEFRYVDAVLQQILCFDHC